MNQPQLQAHSVYTVRVLLGAHDRRVVNSLLSQLLLSQLLSQLLCQLHQGKRGSVMVNTRVVGEK